MLWKAVGCRSRHSPPYVTLECFQSSESSLTVVSHGLDYSTALPVNARRSIIADERADNQKIIDRFFRCQFFFIRCFDGRRVDMTSKQQS